MDSNESLCNKHQDKTVVCNDAFNVSLHLWDEPRTSLEVDGTLNLDCFHLGTNF